MDKKYAKFLYTYFYDFVKKFNNSNNFLSMLIGSSYLIYAKKIKIGFDARVLEWQRGALANFLLNIKEHWTSKIIIMIFIFFFRMKYPVI